MTHNGLPDVDWYDAEAATPPTSPGQPPVQYAAPDGDPNQAFRQPQSVKPTAGGSALVSALFKVAPILLLAGVGLVGMVMNRGTTEAENLAAGDCFNMPTATEFNRLDTEDCSAPHDSQILAVIDLPSLSPAIPADEDEYWMDLFEGCLDAMTSSIVRETSLPENLEFDVFTPSPASWADGDRESLCYLHSPTGLEGSFVDG